MVKRLEKGSSEFIRESIWVWKLLYKLHLLEREDYNTLRGWLHG